MSKKKLYLAYGSNLSRGQMAERCPTARPAGTTEMKGFRLLFRGAHAGAVATVEPLEGGSVPVLAWEIGEDDEAALDRYEGFPFLYRKETVKVKFSGRTVSAMVYVMNEGRPLGQPSCHYYSVIRDGYETEGFDLGLLKQATVDSAKTETEDAADE